MRASQLVTILNKLIEDFGDPPVYQYGEDEEEEVEGAELLESQKLFEPPRRILLTTWDPTKPGGY